MVRVGLLIQRQRGSISLHGRLKSTVCCPVSLLCLPVLFSCPVCGLGPMHVACLRDQAVSLSHLSTLYLRPVSHSLSRLPVVLSPYIPVLSLCPVSLSLSLCPVSLSCLCVLSLCPCLSVLSPCPCLSVSSLSPVSALSLCYISLSCLSGLSVLSPCFISLSRLLYYLEDYACRTLPICHGCVCLCFG